MIRVFGEIIGPGKVRAYNARTLGWNYRMSPLCAAMARSQLTRLDEYTKLRQSAAEYFSSGLREIPGFEPPYVPSDRTHVYHSGLFFPDRVAQLPHSQKEMWKLG